MLVYGLIVLFLALLPALWKQRGIFALLVSLSSALCTVGYWEVLISAVSQTYALSLPGLGNITELVSSPLSAWFGLIFCLGFPLGTLYALGYLKAHPTAGEASHLVWLGLMFLSMHLVLLASNSLVFMLAWELMSLSSFLAILYEHDSIESRKAALYYLITMQVGAGILLLGFGKVFIDSGTFLLQGASLGNVAKWLLLIGFSFKAGFFPFYSWLPKAHPVAPSHLSGLMSGLMIKTGIFGIIWVFLNSTWQAWEIYLLLGVSLVTAFNGVIHALAEDHLKKALAYSSIENIGIIGIALCFWQLGLILGNVDMAALAFLGALLHSFFHSLFKPLLFYLSGNVLIATHSLNLNELGGLDKRMPNSSKLFMMGAASISALPLFCGFCSELVIFGSIIRGFGKDSLAMSICAAVAGGVLAFVSALALIAFSKLYAIVFCGEPRSKKAEESREQKGFLLWSPAILALLCLALGFASWLVLSYLSNLINWLGLSTVALWELVHTLKLVSLSLLLILVVFVLIYLLKRRLTSVSYHATWGCGYQKANPRLQYNSVAYTDPLSYFLKPFLQKKCNAEAPQGYFPTEVSNSEELTDYLDKSLIGGLNKILRGFLALFAEIQNGRTNSYISWLMLALLMLLLWVLGAR